MFATTQLSTSAGRIQIQRPQLLVHFDSGQPQRLHARGIQLNANFPVDAAAAKHLRHTVDAQQTFVDGVVDKPAELLDGLVGGGHRVINERAAIDVFPLHLRFIDAFGKLASHLGNGIANIIHCAVDGSSNLKLDECHRLALGQAASDGVNIAEAGNLAFNLLSNLRFHFRRSRARLGHRHIDQRESDVRLEIDRQQQKGDRADEEQHDKQHDGDDGVADRPGRNIFHHAPLFVTCTLTGSPSCKNAPAVVTTRSDPDNPEPIKTPLETVPATRTARRSTLPCALTIIT